MKKKSIFCLVLVLLLSMVQPALAAETAATMQLSITEGTVKVSNASGRSLTLRDNMRLYSGYQVETSASSYAWINLDSTKLIKLDASTKVEIRKSGKKLEVLLKSGSMYGDVSKPLEADETLDIRTSTAIVGIRGTKFSVAQVKSEKPVPEGTAANPATAQWTTQVQVYEGAVVVAAQQERPETATVAAGNQLTVGPGTEQAETFTQSKLASEHISGYAAVELAKDPETLEGLNIDISRTAAQKLLEQDQADAAQKQAETGKTGLETTADPNVVWGGSASTPSSGGGSSSGGGGSTPDPTPTPDPDPTYTITFDPNGGTGGGAVLTDTAGKLAGSVPAVDRSGYTLAGWNTAADGSGDTVDPASSTFAADTTLYAQWTALPTYTVTFDPNGGTGGGTVLTDTAGKLAGSVPAVDRSEYTLAGWNTTADGSGGTVDPASSTFTADTTLYAQWLSSTVQVDQELSADGSQEAAQQKIQDMLNDPSYTKVTVKLTAYGDSAAPVSTLYLKGALTVPEGKELVMNCYFQVGSNDSYSSSAQEPDGRARAAGKLIVNGTLTVNSGMSLCTGGGVGASTITIGSTGTLTDNTSGTQEIIGNVDNQGTLQIMTGEWHLARNLGVDSPITFTNSGTIENQGTISNSDCTFTNSGTITNTGTLTSNNEITNKAGGTITNTGSMTANGGFDNSGTLINQSGATFTGDAYALGDDAPAISEFSNQSGAKVENHGTLTLINCVLGNIGSFTNTGTLTSGANFNNEIDGTLINSGKLTLNGGTTTNDGSFTNTGTVEAGTGSCIENTGKLQLNAGSQFTIDATFKNTGSVTMTGEDSSPSIFYSNDISGSGSVINQVGGRIEIGAFCQFENAASAGTGVINEGTIIISGGGTLTTNNKFTNTGTLTNNGTYYGPALTGGTIDGANASQVTDGNVKP